MRNLKRALSLTLASVMLLGMMVVGSSAAGYDDVKETDNVEAIEVLQAIEVMVGDERGFGPERPVNRAEMAVVMGKLLNLDYNYYSAACPFNDVYDWARGYVGACYANKILSGRGDGIYDPGSSVTAVEAAMMLMRALGYFQYSNDVADGWILATVTQGNKIGIFDGVGSSADAPMTRNQVAQMVLNALQSAVVEPDGNTTTFLNPDGTVLATTGKVNYVSVTSQKPFARTIGRTQATSVGSQNDGWIVELGERLYDGKLKLTDTTDAFMRPARHWEFDGKDIGTYVKKEQLRQEWSVKVTGRMLYDVLTKPTIDDYDFTIAVDGVETVQENKSALGSAFFTKGNLIRSNTEKVGETGKGVLTQVFVDVDNEDVYVAVINTYLAKATADYNEKRDEATFEVWSVEDTNNSTTNKLLVKDNGEKETLTLSGEDFDVEDVKKDDIILVQVAEGEVKNVLAPEIIDKTEIDTFKRDEWVIAEGTQYDYASSLQYDDDVLDLYDLSNMKDTTYRIYLDKYGYAIGVEIVEEADNYVFLTGIDGNTSNLTNKTADGNLIFTDGTMKTAKINMEKSRALNQSFTAGNDPYTEFVPAALWNTWCTYSVDSNDVYTLTQVANNGLQMTHDDKGLARAGSKRTTDKVGQGRDVVELASPNGDYTAIIDKKHISLNGLNGGLGTSNSGIDGTSSGYSKVYGNDDSVYINVSLKKIDNATKVNPYTGAVVTNAKAKNATIINDVDSVATGVQGVSLNAYDWAKIQTLDNNKYDISDNGVTSAAPDAYSYGVYTLFGDNGYVIAAIVVGEDDGVSSQYAYVFNDDVDKEHWDKTNKEWTWTKDVIIDGELVTLTEVGDGMSELDSMSHNNWYEVKFKANGNVKDVQLISTNDAVNHGEYVFCLTPETANHPNGSVGGSGVKYPKFVGKIELVQQAQVDNTSGKVVLFEDMYTNNANGNSLQYTLSTEGTSLQVKNATGGLVKGFAVSPNAKTVLVQDKQKVDADGNNIGGVSLMDNREYFTGGKAGLESAIKKLNLNKAEANKYFRGYVSAVFENGTAQTVIIYETDPNRVNWGTDINGGTTTVTVANGKITITPANSTPGQYATDEQLVAIRNKLLQLGYSDIEISRDATGVVTEIKATKDNITSKFSTVGVNPPVPKVLTGITVDTDPTTLTYTEGQDFDPTDMVVTATYDDSTTANVTANCTFSVTGGTAWDAVNSKLTLATTDNGKTVTVSYTEGGVTQTDATTGTLTVNARTVTGITATANTGFKITQPFGTAITTAMLTGVSIEVTYDVGAPATIAGNAAGVALTGAPTVSGTTASLTLTYGGQSTATPVVVDCEPTTTLAITDPVGWTADAGNTTEAAKQWKEGDTVTLTWTKAEATASVTSATVTGATKDSENITNDGTDTTVEVTITIDTVAANSTNITVALA